MFLYRNILGQAWKIAWRHKYLWFFGLFAALLGDGGGLRIVFGGFNGNAGQKLFPEWQRLAETGVFSQTGVDNIGQLLTNDPIALLFILAVFLLIIFLSGFLIWLIIVSQSALVHNSAVIITGKRHSFKKGLGVGMKKFWPVLGLNVVFKALVYAIFIAIAWPVITGLSLSQSSFAAKNLLFIASFLVFISLAIVLLFIVKYAVAYVVIKGNNFIEAIQSAWRLFIKNWLVSLEMALMLFLIDFLISLCLLLLLLVLAIPFLFLALIFVQSSLYFYFWLIAIAAMLLYLLIIILVRAGLATFQISSWTGLFLALADKGGVSKIVRVFGRR